MEESVAASAAAQAMVDAHAEIDWDAVPAGGGPTPFNQVAISDWLAVRASKPPADIAVYVSGDQRNDGALTVQELGFLIDTATASSARIEADDVESGQLGVTGALRVQDVLSVGTRPTDSVQSVGRLLVRGAQGENVPLQVWQQADARAVAIVDANGRLGVGTDDVTATLTVQGDFHQPLQGTVTGWADLPTLEGHGTAFLSELRDGDWIDIPDASARRYQVTVQSDTSLLLKETPTANFKQALAYRDSDALVTIQNGGGGTRLSLGRWGDLTVTGTLNASALEVDGLARLTDGLEVAGTATVGRLHASDDSDLAGLTVTGPAQFTSTLEVSGPTTLQGGLRVNAAASLLDLTATGTSSLSTLNASGPARLSSDLGVMGNTSLGTLTVSGSTTLGGLTVNEPAQLTSSLDVWGSTTLNSLGVAGATSLATLTAWGAAQLNDALTVSGASTLGNLTVNGTAVVNNNLTVTNSMVLGWSSVLTTRLTDTFPYDNQKMWHYAIGWFMDSWCPGSATAWLSGYGGVKLFSNGQLGASLNQSGHLWVRGGISWFGATAVGGSESLHMLRGTVEVSGAGEILSVHGTGFSVNRLSAGSYRITFEKPFLDRPSVSVTHVEPGRAGSAEAFDLRGNALAHRLSTTSVRIETGDVQGDHRDRSFSFVVLGPR